ncbi:response regulator [Geomonas sp. Red875]|uniref:histidine kinase n=2 Tax=Geomesophilobacter sediminis TaxID=2798584 RepID=A0A8J7IMA6_9BACT|nr:response regulator [Geomesophilobacter sediminis]
MVIMMSAADSIDYAISALRNGAVDFVRKFTELDDIRHKVENALHRKRLEHRHALMTARLEQSMVFIEALLANAPLGIAVFDGTSGDCVLANRACSAIISSPMDEVRTQNFREIDNWKDQGFVALAEVVLKDGVSRPAELLAITEDEQIATLDCSLSRFEVEGKLHLLLMASDISGKKKLEEENKKIESQMLHVQKLESLGVLAGGIAHDFNNILTAILGNADLALTRLPTASPATDNLRRIEDAAHRAADLARQMLAYSGKGRFVIQPLEVNRVIREMTQMLEVSISKKAKLSYQLGEDLPFVDVDNTQLRQVIMNLVINASEAIGHEPGCITITTGVRECTRTYLSETWIDDKLPEGEYVAIDITDTGCGMDNETVAKIFDPFFTTKFTGRGLGMAAVLGIIRGHRGAIKVSTVLGEGTTFTLLFPISRQVSVPEPAPFVEDDSWRGSGTVLLVDDERTILELGTDMLHALGFQVLTAADGCEAVEVYRNYQNDIVCVILDLTMPQLDGEQTFRELRQIEPQVRVVVSSGYNEQEVTQRFTDAGAVGFVQKPYTLSELTKSLRLIMEVAEEPAAIAV